MIFLKIYLFLALGFYFATGVLSSCETFATRCNTQIGRVLGNAASPENIFNLTELSVLYFSFPQPAEFPSVKMLASVYYGNIEMFVAYGGEVTPTQYVLRTDKGFQDILEVPANIGGSSRNINVMVKAVTPTAVRIISTTSSTSTALSLGFPQIDKVQRGGENIYTFTPLSTSAVSVGITPFIDSDPNIHVTGPGSNPREWSSDDIGADSLLISPSAEEIGQAFSVHVPAANLSYYTITVSEASVDSPTVLMGGFPLEDTSEAGTDLFYRLRVPPGEADVVFVLSPVYGDADIFVNTRKQGFYHFDESEVDPSATWSSQLTYGTDSIVIDSSHPSFLRNGGEYFVTVHAAKDCKFVLRGFSAETVITLSEGAPIIDTVSAKSYHYYRFVNGDPSRDLIFDVSPLSGDPDLLVGCMVKSTGTSDGYPSSASHHFNFSSVRGGEDTLLIPFADPRTCPSGTYYLAVYAFSTSRFSLTATHQGGVVTLQDGVPVQSMSYAYIGKYFRFRVGPEAMQLTLSMTPGTGDLDLFASIDKTVTRFSYEFSSTEDGTAPDHIVIAETESCTDCVVNVLVYGVTSSRFSLVASLEDTTIQLANAQPLKEAVAEHYIQYYTLHASENGTVNVVLTVLSGAPELYLSKTIEKPTSSSPDTVVNAVASVGNLPVAFIEVRAGDILFIGVGGAGTNSTYTVRAHVRVPGTEPLLSLLEATPQGDAIGMNGPSWNYYQINMPAGHESISLRATALVGNIDLYVLKCPYQSSECSGTHSAVSQSYLPDTAHFEFTTVGKSDNVLTVTRNDDEPVSYIVGVDSDSMYAEYHISMSREHSILALSPGTPVSDHAEEGEYDYFSVYAEDAPQVLNIQLTPLAGDVDLFVSTSIRRPNISSSTWKSRKFGDDSIAIDTDLDPNACTGCTYYISVYGYRAGSYSLMVGTESTIGRLLDGVPVAATVPFLSYQRYTFKNNFGIGRNFKVMMTLLSGSASLYVTLDGQVPSFLHSDYHVTAWTAATTSLRILTTDAEYAPCLASECDIRIAVNGLLMANSYSLSITSSAASTVLRMGIPVQASVPANAYDYFKVMLSDPSQGVRLSLTEYSGTAILYASCHTPFPNSSAHTHEWYYMASERNDRSYLEIMGLDLMDQSCVFREGYMYISVRGYTSATYSLTASIPGNATLSRLIPGLAVREYVPFHEFDYFYYLPDSASPNDNLRVIVSSLQGDVDVFVSAWWETRPRYSQEQEDVVSFVLRNAEIGDENMLISRADLREMCSDRVDDCYIVIGVYGAYDGQGVGSSYRIELSLQDSTVVLSSGESVQSRLDSRATDYYKYTVTAAEKDVVVAVTALSGDPDVFVGVEPIRHPSYLNYTWMTAYWGADTLTIQHEELAKHCVPMPDQGKNCDLYIAIYGWRNCSYTIVARMDEGSDHPVTLVDGQPQSGFVALGSYTYYTFYISSHEGQELPASLVVTLTSVEGDQDMYVTMNGDMEPGKNNYDYMSANFGGVSDEVEVGVGMAHYCMNCFVNIAVYGFKEGHYSISATSKGVLQLQSGVAIGGHLDQGQYRYYSIRNTNPTAQITVSLTPISGDPDLYMNVYGETTADRDYEFPRNFHYTWRSIHAGNDQISINYADDHFCTDCTYVVGIYSFRNATFTLLMTDTQNAIVTLTSNRPQIVHITDASEMRYFRASSLTSSEDLTVSLTNMASSAHVPMYISRHPLATYNGSLPYPDDPASYSYSNLHSNTDTIFIVEKFTEPQLYVIGVKPSQPTMLSVLFSSSTKPILLQSGIPQSHYVTQGSMGLFTFYVSQSADVQISISAVSGDPDLFISSEDIPQCHAQNYYSVKCSNYTWSSTSYSTDQIIISKDVPCAVVMPGTHVAPGCTESVFHLGALHIGVYGYSTSRFEIMATLRGGHITLLSGKPQLAYTSLGYVCSDRDKGNGACLASSTQYNQESVAYFSFTYGSRSGVTGDKTILFTVVPTCNASRSSSSGSCQPGCDCNPVGIYITSCPVSQCEASDKFPSYLRNRNKATLEVTSTDLSVALFPDSPAYCNPDKYGEACIYYASVISKQKTENVAFTVSVDTPGDVALISCDSTPSPDGYRLTRSTTLGGTHSAKFFELCSRSGGSGGSSKEDLVVSVEECSGTVNLYACSEDTTYCDSFLPTEKSWQFYADNYQSCQRKKAHSSAATCVDLPNGQPAMFLPERNGNYNVKVNGSGQFFFTVQNTRDGSLLAPALKFDGFDQSGSGKLSYLSTGHEEDGSTLTLSWTHLRVLVPGMATPVVSPNIRYKLYLFEKDPMDALATSEALVLTTPCGLDYAASSMSSTARVISLPAMDSHASEMQHVVRGLQRSTTYNVALVGQCDSSCLRQVSKVSSSLLVSCAGGVDCKAQSFVYESLSSVHTSNKGGDDGGESGGNSLNGFILLALVVVVATGMSLFGVISYYMRSKRQMDELSDFEMTDFSGGMSGSVGDVFSFGGASLTPSRPPPSSPGMSSPPSSGGKSVLSRLRGAESSIFSSYSPLIRDEQQEQDEEEVTVNL